MSSITLPSWFKVDSVLLYMETQQRANASPFAGSEQVVDLLNDRWKMSVSLPPRINTSAGGVEAFVAALRGMTNTVNLYHFGNPVPRGTMRGSPTCGAASQGAASVTLSSAGANSTLLAGDMLGIAGLLLMVAADATANGSGVMTVTLVNRLRTAITGGTAVVWDKPSIPFRLQTRGGVQYRPGYAEGIALDFAEVIS